MPLGVHFRDSDGPSNGQDAPLVARRASKAQQKRQLDYSVECWAGALPMEIAYQRLESLFTTEYGKNIEYYCLVPRDDPESVDMRASCELNPVKLLVCQAGETDVHEVDGKTIDSFIVPPRFRGNGHAIQLVMEMAKTHMQDSESSPWACVGYSEIGQSLWEKTGAHAFEPRETTIPTEDFATTDLNDEGVEYLSVPRIYELLPVDVADVAQQLVSSMQDKTRFAIKPTKALYEATFCRVFDTNRWLRGVEARVPKVLGVRVDDKNWAIWSHHLTHGRLYLLRLVFESTDRAKLILQLACNEAAWWDLGHVVVWNAPRWLCDALDLPTRIRDDNIPLSLCQDPEAVFMVNERYGLIAES